MSAAEYIAQGDRLYLASLNRRIRNGEKHLISIADAFLPVVGQSSKRAKKEKRS
jgi:hypothetical protein